MGRTIARRIRSAPTKRILGVLAVILPVVLSGTAFAATTTTTFQVQITIQASCTILSASTLNFGTQGVLAANVDQTSILDVQCTNTTPYNVGLDAGLFSGATTSTRKMTGPDATGLGYSLFRDTSRTLNLGNVVGTDTVSSTGNGSAQPHTVFGRVPASEFVAPGSYADTITATITF